MVDLLKSTHARILTVVLLLQAVAFYAIASRAELTPAVPPLQTFPTALGGWQMVKDVQIAPDVQEVLKADDTLDRIYASASQTDLAYLFVAFFKTQRNGQSPHSPKNCLPGSGWEPVSTDKPSIAVSGWPTPITINRYVIEHGEDKELVFYWYQSHNRVIASEYSAKFWLVADAIRYRRSDTALVRVIVPIRGGKVDAASKVGVEFVQALFPQLLRQLPL